MWKVTQLGHVTQVLCVTYGRKSIDVFSNLCEKGKQTQLWHVTHVQRVSYAGNTECIGLAALAYLQHACFGPLD